MTLLATRIDPYNPGEVLGCCGISLLLSRECSDARTGFRVEVPRGNSGRGDTGVPAHVTFTVSHELPLADRLVATVEHMRTGGLDWWEERWGLNPHRQLKLWAGHVNPNRILDTLFAAVQRERDRGSNEAWTSLYRPRDRDAKAGFPVDPTGNWNARQLGWSINEHKSGIQHLHRPLLELLAFLGLQEFALRRRGARGGLTYSLWRPATYLAARCAFQGHGPHALAEFSVNSKKSGSYTILDRSDFLAWGTPRHDSA